MISHTHLGTSNLARAVEFYGPVLGALGWCLRFRDDHRQWAGWEPAGGGRPLFIVGAPYDGREASCGNGTMVALLAADSVAVDRAHGLAIEGRGLCEGKPGPRPEYHPGYYGAYFRDPDGHKICVCCHNFEENDQARPSAAERGAAQ